MVLVDGLGCGIELTGNMGLQAIGTVSVMYL